MQRVLFMCVENSCRSQMAEAFGHLHKPDNVAVYSAGSRPSGQVNPRAIALMQELDYDLSGHSSKSPAQLQATDYTAVITMGCGDHCADIKAELHEDWPLPDPKHMPLAEFRQVRDQLGERVKDLLQRLASVC